MRRNMTVASAILIMLTFGAWPLSGQEQPESTSSETGQEDDNPRWWTLSDEITPKELRAIHEDRELQKELYREAVRAGTRDPLPEKRMERLHFFIDGSMRPELFQMWSVFDAFAISFGSEMAQPRASLAEFGFEGQVLEEIVQFCSDYWRQRQVLMTKLMEEAQPALEFVRLGREALGEEDFKAANEAEDTTRLAAATGFSVKQIEEIFETRGRTPVQGFAAQALPLLKDILEPADWNRFRLYLLEVQAPMMSSISSDVLGGN